MQVQNTYMWRSSGEWVKKLEKHKYISPMIKKKWHMFFKKINYVISYIIWLYAFDIQIPTSTCHFLLNKKKNLFYFNEYTQFVLNVWVRGTRSNN